MNRRIALLFAAALALCMPAAAAENGNLAAAGTARLDGEPVFSPTLNRLVATKLHYVGEGAPLTEVAAMTRTAMPGLATRIRCPGKSHCYLEAFVEAQVFNLSGAMGFDLIVDGNALDPSIGSVHVFGADNFEMAQRRFMVRLQPGVHRIAVEIFGTEAFSFVRHAAAYRMYKK